MATLQKFKLFATQCGVGPSPTQSPRTSPLVHMGRPQKNTLRMLLTRGRRRGSDERQFLVEAVPCIEKKGKGSVGAHSLKDLFCSHPIEEQGEEEVVDGKLRERNEVFPLAIGIGGGGDSPRRGFVGLRSRALLRKAWRPVLETIPE